MIPLKQLRTEMRAASEKATSGPWESDQCGDVWSTTAPKRYEEWAEAYLFRTIGTTRTGPDPGDAKYIALANPANLKRLLDALDAAERAFSHIAATCQCEESYELCDCSTSMKRAARAALKALEDGV